jgi:branched-chain amino acid transport system permease protein
MTAAAVGAAVYLLVFLALAKLVASIGLVIVFISLINNRFPDNAGRRVEPILPREPVTIMSDVTVPRGGLWLLGIVVLVAAAVWATQRFTQIGLLTRAATENEKGVVFLGYSPTQMAFITFVGASLIGAFVVTLASPLIQLSSTNCTLGFLVPALGAALICKFRSVWPTVLTNIAIGMVRRLSPRYKATSADSLNTAPVRVCRSS